MDSRVVGMTHAPFLGMLASPLDQGKPAVSAMLYLVMPWAIRTRSAKGMSMATMGKQSTRILFSTAKSAVLAFLKQAWMISRWRSVRAKSVSMRRSRA